MLPIIQSERSIATARGFSLIEFMIAMAIGMVMIMASFVVYRQNLADFQRLEQSSTMVENARAALNLMGDDIRTAGFFGNITDPSAIVDTDVNLTLVPDCGAAVSPDTWALHNRASFSYASTIASAAAATTAFSCIIAADYFQPNTGVLAIKRVTASPVTTYTTNAIYLRATAAVGTLFKQMAGTPAPGASDTIWPYVVNIYYIRNYATTVGDGIPSLYRKTLQVSGGSTSMATETGGLGEGIQYFHVMFGVDANVDGYADYYTSTPALADYANVAAMRIYFLVRSGRALAGIVNSKTYTLGDYSYTAPGDGYLRKVFSTTILTRNVINTRELSQ